MLDLVHLCTLVLLSLSDEVIMNAKLLSNDLSFAELLLSMGDLQGRLQENQVLIVIGHRDRQQKKACPSQAFISFSMGAPAEFTNFNCSLER